MVPAPPPDGGPRGNSAYAAELLRGGFVQRFQNALEREYIAQHLSNNRGLIRAACLLAALLATLRGVEHLVADAPHLLLTPHFALIVTASALLAWAAWSPAFDRLYLPLASVVVPARNAVVAAHLGYVAAHGPQHELMILPLMVIGPFFFLGLPFRVALPSCLLTVMTFIAAGSLSGAPPALLLRVAVILTLATAATAACSWHLHQSSRRRFLESRYIAELAESDALTGMKNRRMFDEHLAAAWAQAITERRRITVLLADVDHFKAYNDRYGHQAGDRALRRIANALEPFVRGRRDILARYGGEEFSAILYDVDAGRAETIAESMRRAVEDLDIEHDRSPSSSRVTLSVGAAVIEPSDERAPRSALQLADEALYTAKRNGRNRIKVVGDDEYRMVITGVFDVAAIGLETTGVERKRTG